MSTKSDDIVNPRSAMLADRKSHVEKNIKIVWWFKVSTVVVGSILTLVALYILWFTSNKEKFNMLQNT